MVEEGNSVPTECNLWAFRRIQSKLAGGPLEKGR